MGGRTGLNITRDSNLDFYVDTKNDKSYVGGETTTYNLLDTSQSGTLTNMNLSEQNGVWVFDGIDGNIPFSELPQLNNTDKLTIEFWGKKSASGEVLGLNSIITGTNKILLYWWSDGNVFFGARNGSSNASAVYTLSYDSDWHHFMGVYDGGSSLKLYIDGTLVNTQTSSVPATLSSDVGTNLNVGFINGTNYSSGEISSIRAYNKTLSQEEITQNIITVEYKNFEGIPPPEPTYVTEGLVLHVDAGDTNSYPGSGTDWFDTTINDNDGVLTNGPVYNSNDGGYITFDGVNDYIELGDVANFDRTDPFSFECWTKTTNTGLGFLMSREDGSATGYKGWNARIQNGEFRISIVNTTASSNYIIAESTQLVNTGDWKYLVCTYDGSSNNSGMILYINGVLEPSANTGGPLNGTTLTPITFKIGRREDGFYFNGDISNTKIYNKVLSQSEVTQNFDSIKVRYGL